MLTQLATVKTRLALDPFDPTYDTLLTRAIEAFSARFDRECNRTLARTVDTVQEFSAFDLEIPVTCYPIESITKFELRTTQPPAWTVQPPPEYLVRQGCVISLTVPFSLQPSAFSLSSLARVTYTGGYLLPGAPDPEPGASPEGPPQRLPADLENAATDQVAFWFQNRDKLGVLRIWPTGGNYTQLVDTDLLPSVRTILKRHTRLIL